MVFNELKRYLKGKIYKITNDINDDVYIGSTTNYIEVRWGQHIIDAYKEENQNKPLYKMIREIGFRHFNIELICEYPCINKGKLEEEENKYIKQYGTLNIKNNNKSERHIISINKQTNKIISDILNNIINDVIHYTLYDKYINNFINNNFRITKSYKNRIFIREIIDLIEIDESSIDKKDFLKIVKEKLEKLGGIYDNCLKIIKKQSSGFFYVSLKKEEENDNNIIEIENIKNDKINDNNQRIKNDKFNNNIKKFDDDFNGKLIKYNDNIENFKQNIFNIDERLKNEFEKVEEIKRKSIEDIEKIKDKLNKQYNNLKKIQKEGTRNINERLKREFEKVEEIKRKSIDNINKMRDDKNKNIIKFNDIIEKIQNIILNNEEKLKKKIDKIDYEKNKDLLLKKIKRDII